MAYANYQIFNVENFKAIKLNLLKKIKVCNDCLQLLRAMPIQP